MKVRSSSRNENLPRIRTRFNARVCILVAMSILLCAGIAGCEGSSGTAPGAFVLSSPASGATNLTFTPTLTWTDASGETSYTVEIDDENTFSSPLQAPQALQFQVMSLPVGRRTTGELFP